MTIRVYPENPEIRKIRMVCDALREGKVIVYPTDTTYALGCDILQQKAIDQVCAVKKMDPNKALLTMICNDISQMSEFTPHIPTNQFRLLKKNIPGPFTFIFRAGSQVPKRFRNRRKTFGMRVPDHPIPHAIVAELGRPILSTSLKQDEDAVLEYYPTIHEIEDIFGGMVDIIIDGGPVTNDHSTIIDATGQDFEIVRQGIAELRL